MQEFPPKKIFEAKYENLCDYKNSLEATFVFWDYNSSNSKADH